MHAESRSNLQGVKGGTNERNQALGIHHVNGKGWRVQSRDEPQLKKGSKTIGQFFYTEATPPPKPGILRVLTDFVSTGRVGARDEG